MKKIISIMLIMILLTLFLSACSSGDNNTVTGPLIFPNVTPRYDDSALAFIVMRDGGIIALELYYRYAPNTVRNFIYLAENDFYNGLIFHRVIDGFMIQGGCADGTGTSTHDWNIKGEFPPNGFEQNTLSHVRGVISMARLSTSPAHGVTQEMAFNSASTQFFIMTYTSPNTQFLDNEGYAAFGRVLAGMDVVDRIRILRTGANYRPNNPPIIDHVLINTRGNTFAPPEKLPIQVPR